jgi:hypothetical protein
VITLKKILYLVVVLCAVMAACIPPASANFLSLDMNEPATVSPGEIFTIGVLVTNLAPVYLDHCNFGFSIDPWVDLIMLPWGEPVDAADHLHSFFDTLAMPPPYGTSGYFGLIVGKVCEDTPVGTVINSEFFMEIIADDKYPSGDVCYGCWGDSATASGSMLVVSPDDPSPVPEFPTLFLPAGMIIGILGTVFFIRRNRDH